MPSIPRSFRLACVLGGAAATVVVVMLATNGHWDLWPRHYTGDFYDAQARAWFAGRWDMPFDVLGREAYRTDNGFQMYFGVFPSLLRVPVLLVTTRFDGRSTQISQLVAFVLTLVAVARLLWSAHCLSTCDPGAASLSVDTEANRWIAATGGALVFVAGSGSVVAFLAMWPSVYHESLMWAVALALGSLDHLVRFLMAPRTTSLIWAGVFAGATLLTRVTTGVAVMVPLVALAAIAVGLRRRGSQRLLPSDDWPAMPELVSKWVPQPGAVRRSVGLLVTIAIVPFILYGAVNFARFGHPWKVPYDRQLVYEDNVPRANRLAGNGGSLFGLRFVPSNLVAYSTPFGVRLGVPPPYISMRDYRDVSSLLGDVPYDLLGPTASAPAAMPLFIVLSGFGLVVLARRSTRSRYSPLRLPALGAGLAAFVPLTYAGLAYRYIGEVFPLLVLTSAVGWAHLVRIAPRSGRVSRLLAGAGFGIVAIATAWAGIGLSLTQSRILNPRSVNDTAAWVNQVSDIEGIWTGAPAFDEREVPGIPTLGARVRTPACERLYIGNGLSWVTVERKPGTGALRLRAPIPVADGRVHALVRTRDGMGKIGLTNRDGSVVTQYSSDGGATWNGTNTMLRAPASAVARNGTVDLIVDFDWAQRRVLVDDADPDGQPLLNEALLLPSQAVEVVDDPGTASVEELVLATPICDRWFPRR